MLSTKKPGDATAPDKVPPFFDADMQKWHNKFEKAINERTSKKKLYLATHEFNLTTKNSNFQKT